MAASSANCRSDAGVPGKDVYLTIDAELQQFAEQRLGDESAACVRDGRANRRRAGAGLDARLRPQSLQCRHHQRRNGSADERRPQAAAEQGACAAPIRRARPSSRPWRWRRWTTGSRTLQVNCTRRADARQSRLPLLEEGRPWPRRSASRHPGLCDIFFYEVARRLGIDKMEAGGARARPGRADRHRDSRRDRRFHPEPPPGSSRSYGVPWQQGETLSRRHRPGLCAGDAAAALHAGRAHRQRQGADAAHRP